MRVDKIPFNIALIDSVRDKMLFSLFAVNSLAMFDNNSGDFHPQGLFSNVIFGRQGEERRFTATSYIELKTSILHPFYVKRLKSIKPLFRDILLGIVYAKWNPKLKTFESSSILEGETGYAFFMSHFNELTIEMTGNTARRQDVEFLMENKQIAQMTKYIVIPAGLRDVEIEEGSRPVEDDLNPLYRTLLSQVSTVNAITAGGNDKVLDNAKRALLLTSEAIFDHILGIVEGKNGFFQSQFQSHTVFGTTRNVISAQEVSPLSLDDPRAPQQDVTAVGLPQFMSGLQPKMRYQLRNVVISDFLDNVRNEPLLYDPKTLELVKTKLPEKLSDKWGTDEGLNAYMASFLEPNNRHRQIKIMGNYLLLIYRDDKGFKLIKDINDVPKDKRDGVKPITWGELFYLAAAPIVDEVRGYNTRYPVTGLGSIFPSRTYLKTTEASLYIKPYDDDWNLIESNTDYVEFPNVEKATAFHETMVVHSSTLVNLGADFDGDMLSWSPVWSVDAVKEVDDYLNNVSTYIKVSGELTYKSTTDVTDWVLNSLTNDV